MSLESSALKLADKVATAGLSEKVQSCIKSRSLIAAIITIIPLWGFDSILYAIVLWGMYAELCKLAQVPFWSNFFTSVIGGFIVNVVVVFILGLILDFIPIVGWIANAVVGYCATLFSGCAYLEVLASLHDKGKVKERFKLK